MINVPVEQQAEIDRLAEALAASFHLKPHQWMCKHGHISYVSKLPIEYRHLADDYRETQREMKEALK
ncbi:hypothetical protein BCS95_05495 [Vibrio breoganii]|uniref:hypothetical protein n=1 Tax=Vibrio breoganii TaxID=553239 RepID=UPI000C83D991|nr:hypothetical protein [Vibrio breoganii]PMP04572.1 hypothetical protein BCS95_05495 [Vibrio breoganii]